MVQASSAWVPALSQMTTGASPRSASSSISGCGSELGFGKGTVPFFAALGILDAGKMHMEPPGTLIPQCLGHAVEDGGIIGLGLDAAQRAGVQVPEVDAGRDALIHTAQGQHLVQRAQLAHLAHRLRAEDHVGKARLIQCFHGTAQTY